LIFSKLRGEKKSLSPDGGGKSPSFSLRERETNFEEKKEWYHLAFSECSERNHDAAQKASASKRGARRFKKRGISFKASGMGLGVILGCQKKGLGSSSSNNGEENLRGFSLDQVERKG